MYLVYLGESGNTGNSVNDPHQPHHVHVGLLVHESQSIPMGGEFNALWRRHFGRPLGEAGSLKELRPADLYQGCGAFASWPPVKRKDLVQDCLGILIQREIPLIIAYVDKKEFAQVQARGDDPNPLWENPSGVTLSRFLLALSMFVDELNMSTLDSQQLMENIWPIKRELQLKYLREHSTWTDLWIMVLTLKVHLLNRITGRRRGQVARNFIKRPPS